MNTSVGFPTIGELIQFAYETAGVLPRKRGVTDDFDETEKKSLQKALSRLAEEEGDINKNIQDLLLKLVSLLEKYVPSVRVNSVISNTLMELLEVYQAFVKDDGTYLDKQGTIQWLITEFIIGRLAISIKKNTLKFNVTGDEFSIPSGWWYLPTIESEKIVYPLEKVLRWIYEEEGLSQRKFHCPDESNAETSTEQEQNLNNAKNWIKAKNNLPSLPALLWNIDYSMALNYKNKGSDSKLNINSRSAEEYYVALFIARVSTFVFKEIFKRYGISFVGEICEQFERQYSDFSEELLGFERITTYHLKSKPFSNSYVDYVWFNETDAFFADYASTQHRLTQFLTQKTHDERLEIFQNPSKVEELTLYFGKFPVQSIAAQYNRKKKHEVPPNFIECLFEGLDLKKNHNTSIEEIENFSESLNVLGIQSLLPWLAPWIKGAYHYRREEYDLAFPFFKEAFDSAKYCAGHQQYKLVNQYVELAAKNDKRREFNRAVSWAHYIGLEIRWLRSKELTEENLDFVFTMMKRAVYPSL